MTRPIIEIEGVGKRYKIGAAKEPYLSLRDELVKWVSPAARRARAAQEEFWALKEVSFSVQPGEAVGIIGRNGAGKSTLLKILSQITPPTTGKVTCRGRIASLLEVGTGFHPEFTGRENIYMNGAILGMSRSEITRKFDEIVAFAEMEQFLDTPVKRYSSGMYVRLAFAVAAHLEPEILIVDEVLAVGDAQFQQKCLGKMGEVARGGRTVLFVSHNMSAIQSLCCRAVLMARGHAVLQGQVRNVVGEYNLLNTPPERAEVDGLAHPHRIANMGAIIHYLRIGVPDGGPQNSFDVGDAIAFHVVLESTRPLHRATLGLHVHNEDGHRILTFHTRDQLTGTLEIRSRIELSCVWRECNVMPGRYSLVAAFEADDGTRDRLEPALTFVVRPADYFGTGRMPPVTDGFVLPRCDWMVSGNVRVEILV